MERRRAVAELAQSKDEAGRVGATRDQAEHLAARLEQVVAADVDVDPLEQIHRPKCAYQVGSSSHVTSVTTARSSSSAVNG